MSLEVSMAPDALILIWTITLYLAYPVDFNKSLASFESAILSLRRLIDFALSSRLRSPPGFVFISSVSSVNRESPS